MKHVHRRSPCALAALAWLQGSLAGCSSDARPSDVERAEQRLECAFDRGSRAEETLGREVPVGRDIPIDHFIVLMLENRSFDHYFGAMPGVDGFPAGASNPDAQGAPVSPYHETEYCIEDVAHSWSACHEQYGGGTNDGFVVTNDPGGARAMGYYDETDLPFYYDLYRTFAMSDRHFCSALSSTWTNRWYFTSATSFGRTFNQTLPDGFFAEHYGDEPYNIYTLLESAGLDWRLYYSDVPWAIGGYPETMYDHLFNAGNGGPVRPLEDFYRDVEAGDLPEVTYLDPSYFAGVEQTDEHPPANPQFGQAFVAEVVDAVMRGPLWSRTALIVTYDEHGGYYDHVPPPSACVPDDFPARDSDGSLRADGFDRLGFRVPLLVVSPYARRGHVSHEVTDHTSILRLIEARFGLGALSRRDANAWPMTDMFDFEHPDFSIPQLVEPTIDEARVAACHAAFP